MSIIKLLLLILLTTTPLFAQMSPEEALAKLKAAEGQPTQPMTPTQEVDLSTLDEDALRTLASQLYERIAELEQRVYELESQLSEPSPPQEIRSQEQQWTVRIVSNSRGEDPRTTQTIPKMEENIRMQQLRMHRLRNDIATERERIKKFPDSFSRVEQWEREKDVLARELRTAEQDLRNAKLQRKSNTGYHDLTIALEDGRPITLRARGTAPIQLAQSLLVGKRYLLTGIEVTSAESEPYIELLTATFLE